MASTAQCARTGCRQWVHGQAYCFDCTDNGHDPARPANAHFVRACECERGAIYNHSDGVCALCAAEFEAVADW